jgi:hypothetical protein
MQGFSFTSSFNDSPTWRQSIYWILTCMELLDHLHQYHNAEGAMYTAWLDAAAELPSACDPRMAHIAKTRMLFLKSTGERWGCVRIVDRWRQQDLHLSEITGSVCLLSRLKMLPFTFCEVPSKNTQVRLLRICTPYSPLITLGSPFNHTT